MGTFERQLSAAARQYEHFEPDDDCERDERVAERTDELFAERIKDEARVLAAMDDFFCMGDGDRLERALTAFYIDFDAADTDTAMAQAGYALFRSLQPNIEASIRRDAESDAEAEETRRETENAADAAEARDMAREDWR